VYLHSTQTKCYVISNTTVTQQSIAISTTSITIFIFEHFMIPNQNKLPKINQINFLCEIPTLNSIAKLPTNTNGNPH